MRRKDREVTNPQEIARIVETAKILHLGLFDEDYPYVVPLHYGCEWHDERLFLYLHCAREGHKLDLIARNPHVTAEIDCDVELVSGGDVACAYGSTYASVIARGTAALIDDPQEKAHALELLMRHQTGRTFTFNERMTSAVAVVRISVDDLTAKSRPKMG